MSDTTARKAVVTTAQVQAQLDIVNTILHKLDSTHVGTEFDRGGRKGGFAEYRADETVVRSFDTKDSALTFYTALAEGMRQVAEHPNVSIAEHATEDQINAAIVAGEKAVANSRRKAPQTAAE